VFELQLDVVELLWHATFLLVFVAFLTGHFGAGFVGAHLLLVGVLHVDDLVCALGIFLGR